MEGANKNGDGVNAVWKAAALMLCSVLIAGAPGIIYALRTWNVAAETRLVHDRQDDVRNRLAVAEAKAEVLEARVNELEQEVRDLSNYLNRRP